jgi:hypothetical protein
MIPEPITRYLNHHNARYTPRPHSITDQAHAWPWRPRIARSPTPTSRV